MPTPVAVLIGSLRKESWTRKVANLLIEVAPPSFVCDIVPIGDLPHYDQDLETATPPAEWVAFRKRIAPAKAVLFVTPEYNRSVPGVLKNAIDVGSRPRETEVWAKKPAAVVSVSPGNLSGFGANHHLRQMLVFLDMPTLQQPEMYVGQVATAIENAKTKEFLKAGMAAFGEWIGRVGSGL